MAPLFLCWWSVLLKRLTPVVLSLQVNIEVSAKFYLFSKVQRSRQRRSSKLRVVVVVVTVVVVVIDVIAVVVFVVFSKIFRNSSRLQRSTETKKRWFVRKKFESYKIFAENLKMKKRKLKVGDLKKFQRTILFPETLNLGSKIFSPQKYFLEVSKQRPGFFVFESVFFFSFHPAAGFEPLHLRMSVTHQPASRNMHPFLLGGSNLCFIVGKAPNEASANTLISVMRKKNSVQA